VSGSPLYRQGSGLGKPAEIDRGTVDWGPDRPDEFVRPVRAFLSAWPPQRARRRRAASARIFCIAFVSWSE